MYFWIYIIIHIFFENILFYCITANQLQIFKFQEEWLHAMCESQNKSISTISADGSRFWEDWLAKKIYNMLVVFSSQVQLVEDLVGFFIQIVLIRGFRNLVLLFLYGKLQKIMVCGCNQFFSLFPANLACGSYFFSQ